MNTNSVQAASAGAISSEIHKARFVAVLLGVVMLFSAGFSQSTSFHNAAHDTRHTLAFPCH